MTIEIGLLAVIALFTVLHWFESLSGDHRVKWLCRKARRAYLHQWRRLRHRGDG